QSQYRDWSIATRVRALGGRSSGRPTGDRYERSAGLVASAPSSSECVEDDDVRIGGKGEGDAYTCCRLASAQLGGCARDPIATLQIDRSGPNEDFGWTVCPAVHQQHGLLPGAVLECVHRISWIA